jgi:hypothetical protein
MIRASVLMSLLTFTLVACSAAETDDIESNEGSAATDDRGGDFYIATGEIRRRDQDSRVGIKGVNLPQTVCTEQPRKFAAVCEVTHVDVEGISGTDPETFGRLRPGQAVIRGRITQPEADFPFLKATEVYSQRSNGSANGTYYLATATESSHCATADACKTMKLTKLNGTAKDSPIEVSFPNLEPLFKGEAVALDLAIDAIRSEGGAIVAGTVAKGQFTPTAVFVR